jgi:hypothetical protein
MRSRRIGERPGCMLGDHVETYSSHQSGQGPTSMTRKEKSRQVKVARAVRCKFVSLLREETVNNPGFPWLVTQKKQYAMERENDTAVSRNKLSWLIERKTNTNRTGE